ncbi:hypothetical protein [Aquimarina pacifica]|uniref:hypothetical protein n=1 Tax=Aquimarina pacifica TaxID=1296415 RepID=UPI00046E6672|nr:hypothetical protein [Aquimarina pacifica]
MKKIFLFIITTFFFIACDDDDSSQIDLSLIYGNWALTSVTSENGTIATIIEGTAVDGTYEISGKEYSTTLTFTESASADLLNSFSSSGDFTQITAIKTPLQSFNHEEVIPDFIGSREWTIDENIILTFSSNTEEIIEIIWLTAETMILRREMNETVEIDGITFEITGSQIIELDKR